MSLLPRMNMEGLLGVALAASVDPFGRSASKSSMSEGEDLDRLA